MRDKNWANRTIGFNAKNAETRIKLLDGYSSPRIAVEYLLKHEKFSPEVWEPANGLHKISEILEENNYTVHTSDIHKWSNKTEIQKDFHSFEKMISKNCRSIVTNPPFSNANEFVLSAMKILPNPKIKFKGNGKKLVMKRIEGGKLALLLRVQFFEGTKRKKIIWDVTQAKTVYVFSFRLPRMHQFFYKGKESTSAMCFSWFVWEKGYKGKTETVIL